MYKFTIQTEALDKHIYICNRTSMPGKLQSPTIQIKSNQITY